MKPNTLTTVDQLKPGDIFCHEKTGIEMILTKGKFAKSCHLYKGEAVLCYPGRFTVRKFIRNDLVIYLGHNPDLLTQKINV